MSSLGSSEVWVLANLLLLSGGPCCQAVAWLRASFRCSRHPFCELAPRSVKDGAAALPGVVTVSPLTCICRAPIGSLHVRREATPRMETWRMYSNSRANGSTVPSECPPACVYNSSCAYCSLFHSGLMRRSASSGSSAPHLTRAEDGSRHRGTNTVAFFLASSVC